MRVHSENWNKILLMIRDITSEEKVQLIEQLAQSLQRPNKAPEGKESRQNIREMMEKLEAMPVGNPDDGFSSKDHDKIIYGGNS